MTLLRSYVPRAPIRCSLALVLATLFAAGVRAQPLVLGMAGDRFTVNGSPQFLVFISYFDGLRRVAAGDIDTDLRYLARLVDGIRVLPNWWGDQCTGRAGTDTLIDMNGAIREETWRNLERLLEAAATHQLFVDVSFTRETVTDNGSPAKVLSVTAYAAALNALIGRTEYLKGKHPHVLVDVQNEWPRFTSEAAVERLLTELRTADPDRILVASSSGDAYVPVGRSLPRMAAAYHDPRGGNWFEAEKLKRVVASVRESLPGGVQPVYLQEPMPWTAICPGQIRDEDSGHFLAAVKNARAAGAAAWTFHTRLGFDLRTQSLVSKLAEPSQAAQKATIEGLRESAR